MYEEIAGHFSDTRHTAWPQVAQFLQQQPGGSLVVDIGCGNGKYLGINDHLFKVSTINTESRETERGNCWIVTGD